MNFNENILIIDDDISILKGFEKVLSDRGFVVDTAMDGRSALDTLGKRAFNVIIIDMVLDDVYGLDLIDKIKEISASVPIIVITGYPSVKSAVSSFHHGAFEYLEKPCSTDKLIDAIEKCLTSYKKQEFILDTKDEKIAPVTSIGIIAGEILGYLGLCDKIILTELCNRLKFPKTYILMSIGWLAREGHITLKKAPDGDFEISLHLPEK